MWITYLSCLAAACSSDTGEEEPSSDLAAAESPATVAFFRDSGGSVKTNLGYGIVLNSKSELNREWVVAQDTTLPVRIVGVTGPRTVYASQRYSGNYQYRANVQLQALDSLTAVEVRFVLFDIWGDFIRTLTMTEVQDIPAGTTLTLTPTWNLFSENEASEFYASLGYIARVRTVLGQVHETPVEPIVAEARRFAEQFAPEQLTPIQRPPVDSVASSSTAT